MSNQALHKEDRDSFCHYYYIFTISTSNNSQTTSFISNHIYEQQKVEVLSGSMVMWATRIYLHLAREQRALKQVFCFNKVVKESSLWLTTVCVYCDITSILLKTDQWLPRQTKDYITYGWIRLHSRQKNLQQRCADYDHDDPWLRLHDLGRSGAKHQGRRKFLCYEILYLCLIVILLMDLWLYREYSPCAIG